MAQRFYLPVTGTAPASPAFDSLWDDSASATRVPLVTTASNTTNTTVGVSEATATGAWDVLVRQWVSDVLPATTISGTFDAVLQATESTGTADMFLQVVIRVVDGDGSEVRGTLYAGTTNTSVSATSGAINQELSTTTSGLATRIYSGVSLTSVDASAGDRIAVEMGYRACNTSSSSFTGSLRVGDATAGADWSLTAGQTSGSTNRPWIEFSQDVFTSTAASVSLAGTVTPVTGAFDVLTSAEVSLAGTAPPVTAAFDMSASAQVSLAGTVPAVTGAFTTGIYADASLAGTVASVTGAFTLDAAPSVNNVSLAGTVAPVTGSFNALTSAQVSLAGSVPPVTAAFNVAGVFPSAYYAAVMADSPTAYYRLNEDYATGPDGYGRGGPGATLVDSSGNGYDGEYPDNTYYFNQPGLIVGDTDHTVRLGLGPMQSVPITGTPLTFSVEFLASGSGAYESVSLSRSDDWHIAVNYSDNTVTASLFLGSTVTLSAPIRANGGTSHYALTVDTTIARLYVDKVQVASAAKGSFTGADNPVQFYAGPTALVDEIAYYDSRVLSAAEIAAHYDTLEAAAEVTGTIRPVTGSFTVQGLPNVTLAGTVRPVTGSFNLRTSLNVALAGTVAPVTGAFTLDAPTYLTVDTSNSANGLRLTGTAEVVWEPPVEAPPAGMVMVDATHSMDVVEAVSAMSVSGAQPTITLAKTEKARHRDRILVGGKDISFLRGFRTPCPDYSLIEPLMYGPGRLTLPQVNPLFEQVGAGALRWLAKGSPVVVQRVNAANEVVATDYVGFIADWDVDGNAFTADLGGEASGRAAMLDRQPPLWRARRDGGAWAYDTVHGDLGLRFEPRLGPTTGIKIASLGGMSQLDYLNNLCAQMTTTAGNQWTIMPGGDRAYRMQLKDRTTIDATVYFGDQRTKPNLHSDVAEEPNRIFVTGTTPSGQKVKFGVYPGLRQGEPPAYPFNDNRTFGIGTEDADTDTGDGVSAMVWKLQQAGYLDRRDAPGGYDDDVADAIERLQEDAGLNQSGVMGPSAWDALYDLDVTGWTFLWSKILPAAQRSKVKQWNRTSNGSLSSKNPDYDKHALVVDQTINMGTGFTRQQMRRWGRAELADAATDNWIGTVDLGAMAVVRGEHTPGDVVLPADVMPGRALRPGMNVLAPLFHGGTLFHVSGVDVSNDGRTVVPSLDTRARDTMKVWEVIQRNRDSRRNPARAWVNQYRSSQIGKDGLVTWDEIGGTIDDRVRLTGGTWNVFPVLAGQEGTVSRVRIQTNPPTEFVMAITGRELPVQRWNHLVPDPLGPVLTVDGDEVPTRWETDSVRERLDDWFLLYAAGTNEQPCGWWPGHKTGSNGGPTLADVTGRHDDDASFGFRTFAEPVLYVAVWPVDDCSVRPGRILWQQQEEGS